MLTYRCVVLANAFANVANIIYREMLWQVGIKHYNEFVGRELKFVL